MIKIDRLCRRMLDVFFALMLLFPALLIFVLILPIQLWVFRGGIFFMQHRVGRFGKPLRYFKLKTMSDMLAQVPDHGRAQLQSERIGSWGKFLRLTHIDELPELLLILRGNMSFVGPRPLMTDHEKLVGSVLRRRCAPGWTGLSQIYLHRKKLLPSRVQRRLDAHMAETLDCGLYLRILSASVLMFFGKQKAIKPLGPTVLQYRRSLQEDA